MIEINLVPDVKQQLINAQRIRTTIVSIAILIGIAAVGLVVVLALLLGGQKLLSDNADGSIKSEASKLTGIADIDKTVTIQNQLAQLSQMHNSKSIDSRLFDVLSAVNPSGANAVKYSSVKLDPSTKTITISGSAAGLYAATDVFKKTIQNTRFQYTSSGNQQQDVLLTQSVNLLEQSFGEDSEGKQVLRFTMSFTYPDDLFARTISNAKIVTPTTATNVTDSRTNIPTSLFSDPPKPTGGAN